MRKYLLLLLILFCVFPMAHAQNGNTDTAREAFDVAAATQRYLDMLSPAQKARSDAYFEGGYWLMLWNLLYSLAIGFVFLSLGLSAWIKNIAQKVKNVNLQNYIYGVLYFVFSYILIFPLNVYQGFVREHQYALSNMSFTAWLRDEMIGLALVSFGGSLLLVAVYFAMRRTGRDWWIWAAGITMAFTFFISFIAPVFLSPLFNKYTPLADGPLKQQILSLARAKEIPAENVYQFDASRQSDRVSANVSGIASATRISLNDNLLRRCTPAEIKAVMGHEMGHYVMNHVYKGLTEALILVVVLFWLVNFVFNKISTRFGITDISDISSLPLLIVLFAIAAFLATPITNTMTRTQETEADMFGLNAAREPDAEAHVDILLSEYRKIDPGYWEEIIFYDHPSGRRRVHMAMQWKAENLK